MHCVRSIDLARSLPRRTNHRRHDGIVERGARVSLTRAAAYLRNERLIRKVWTRLASGYGEFARAPCARSSATRPVPRLTSAARGVIVAPARPFGPEPEAPGNSGSARIETMKSHRALVGFVAAVSIAAVIASALLARAADTPRRGGILLAAIAADAPSLDPHQEETFATLHLVAPCYSTLLQIDPYSYPKIIGDLATEWKIAPDGLTYTFKLRSGVRFHDGSPLTSADVKATYDKIVFPPAGVRSIRRNTYAAVTSIETPDAATIVFKLKHPSASLLANLASPWNVVYPKKYLDKDPNYFKTNILGS